MTVSRPDNQTLAERLAGEIADDILKGKLEPGRRLDEQSLADRYKSRARRSARRFVNSAPAV